LIQASSGFRAILLDVEGTTTPASFVLETLFPYARARLEAYVAAGKPVDLPALRGEHQRDSDASRPAWVDDSPISSALAYLTWLMDRDRKSKALKDIQGQIWRQGYGEGHLAGQVYPDVPPAFERWKGNGLKIAIFSSGSVLAQRLLFGSVPSGDLTQWIDDYFDTATGPKNEPLSYLRIARALECSPGSMLFVSDAAAELAAAGSAGCSVSLCVRGAGGPRVSGLERIRSFDELP